MTQKLTQAVVVNSPKITGSSGVERIALFNSDGTPFKPVGAETPVIAPTVVPLSDAANILVDASAGTYFTVTIAGNRTLAPPTNATDGQEIVFEVKQDATGSRTLAYSSAAGGYSFGAASAPTVTATAAATSKIKFQYSARVGKWLYVSSQLGF
jgi:hypothetical protein